MSASRPLPEMAKTKLPCMESTSSAKTSADLPSASPGLETSRSARAPPPLEESEPSSDEESEPSWLLTPSLLPLSPPPQAAAARRRTASRLLNKTQNHFLLN